MRAKFTALLLLVCFLAGVNNIYAQDARVKTFQQGSEGAPVISGPALNSPMSNLSESFESATFPPAGWTLLNPGGGTGWNRQTVGTTPVPGFNGGSITAPTGGGTGVAFCNYVTGGTGASTDQWLVTPRITNVQANDSLNFWLRWWSNLYGENVDIKISTTTPTVAAFNINVATISFVGNVSLDTIWKQYKYKIGNLVPAGSDIYIAFRERVADANVDGATISLDLVNVVAATAPVQYGWMEQTTGITTLLQSVSAVDNNVVWAAGAGGKVLRSTNGGMNWANVTTSTIPATLDLYNIWATDANTALVTGSNTTAFVYKTTNGGANWTQVFSQTGGFINAMWLTDGNNGFMTGDPANGRWSLFRTTNGGTTWDSTGLNLPQVGTEAGWNNSLYMSGSNIWFGTNNTRVYYSSNNGANWTAQVTTGQASSYAVWFNNATNGLAGGAELVMTTNGGSIWVAEPSTGTSNISGITGINNNWWFTRQTNSIYFTSDNGGTWQTQYTAPNAGVYWHIGRARTGTDPFVWAVQADGGISRYGTMVGVISTSTEVPSQFKLSQNYPNPFNPTTNINFALPKAGLVTLKVYNVLGEEVATLVNEVKQAGSYKADFNAATLTSGVYFYKLTVDGFSEVKKMMLVK